jgi:exopolyphosphatase/guanosine-5'-triphosphate,3'-diphosphate pyrophosphatase
VDVEQAARVERTALDELHQVGRAWELGEDSQALLRWAARLHEIGLTISYSGYHKHGAYVLQHADLPGFSREEQATLAALVGAHRRRFDVEPFRALPEGRVDDAIALALLLRLAVLLNRSRSRMPLPRVRLRARRDGLEVRFPRGWLRLNPLTREDLEDEAGLVRAAGLKLDVG